MSAVHGETDGKVAVPDFFGVLGIDDIETYDPEEIWARNAHADSVAIPIGHLRVGDALIPELSTLDFSRDGNNGAVQGRVGSGRSHFLRSMVLSLATRYGPDRVSLFLADAVGSVMFRGFEALPHTVANVSGHAQPEETFDWATAVLTAEVQRREDVLASKQCRSSAEYRRERCVRADDDDWPPLPDLVAILDEFSWILEEYPGRRDSLARLVSVGARVGVHLLLAGQHFNETMLDGLNEQLGFRLSLKVNDLEHSRALIGTDDAAFVFDQPFHVNVLRKLPSDVYPTPMVGFHIDARFPAVPDGIDETDAEVHGEKMSDLVLNKLAGLKHVHVVPYQLDKVEENVSRTLTEGAADELHR